MNLLTRIRLDIIAPVFARLPRFKGKYRLARLILGNSLNVKNRVIKTPDGCQFFVPSLREPVSFGLLINGVYEPDSLELILKKLTKDAVFLDIGANIGCFSITTAKLLEKQNISVIAIEASPTIFAYLQNNIEANLLTNVKALNLAAAERDESSINFYEAPLDQFGMGSLSPQFNNCPTIQVKTKTIDSILKNEQINKVDLLKVDVEGYESSVFVGARELLISPNAPMILFEFCDSSEARKPNSKVGDAQRILVDFGYKIYRLKDYLAGGKPLDGVLVQGFDMLVAVKHGA
ncbi:FkbM family methyltransferase [Chrysosporum ovalisporum CS-1034]|uniref:FkbM family methyltransferase n=1 Tax=Umezakia ovalisporum TaxID=75695 RepID=UPI0024735B69|nr:FkbM family methyltransferase [Umezakia ovalisporum]MDH6072978.1 FkbM family methyltransferase [Umezakia ovalisporum CS-1034]